VLLGGRVEAIPGLGAFVGKEAEVFRRPDRGLGHEAVRLAGIDTLQHRDIVGMVFDRVGDAMEQFLPRRRRHVAPGFEGGRGRGCGAVDVFGIAARHRRQHRAVDRGFRLERLARSRRHGLAIDHVADALAL
jgi:hypothetical protein